MSEDFDVITGGKLAHMLDVQPPANDRGHGGYALMNVLPEGLYCKEHIPWKAAGHPVAAQPR